ncbi:protein of unknown function [Paraburkholderia dioscoreae]|uniref:Uncharacterized protein n=1 Tax=Paraburkholderia dioscoreae TaxID=2604047 RepID=A0A5Q4YVQ1_9BURK|nr:protein of unknown function [Paraburkholderia dioscoreae]
MSRAALCDRLSWYQKLDALHYRRSCQKRFLFTCHCCFPSPFRLFYNRKKPFLAVDRHVKLRDQYVALIDRSVELRAQRFNLGTLRTTGDCRRQFERGVARAHCSAADVDEVSYKIGHARIRSKNQGIKHA